MTRTTGGTLLARSLKALGVSDVFVLHGGHLDSFLVACPHESIRLIDFRHEASAGHAAAAYARVTGKVGVSAITAGPGFTNAITAMADAYLDATPTLFIASSTPLRETETNALQGGIDQVAIATPVVKWAHRVTEVDRIPDLVDKALRIAASGRPGPVYLEVPIDIMFRWADDLPLPHRPALITKPAPAPEAIEAILELLAKAERPVLIVGGGLLFSSGSGEALTDFIAATGVPVMYSQRGNGVLAGDHPLNLGSAFGLGALAGTENAPDLVIQIGARFGMSLGGRSGGIVPVNATLVHVDVDEVELGRIKTPDVSVVADSSQTLAALARAADGSADATRFGGWVATLKSARAGMAALFDDAPEVTERGYIHPHAAAVEVAKALTPDTAVTFDGGETPAWFVPLVTSPGPGLVTGNGYLGTLGVGQGYAIGIAIARPGKPVAAITGDGAVGFNIAEIDTMARYGLPITTVIFNNGSWGISRHGQQLVFGPDETAAVDLERRPYELVAEGLGGRGIAVTRLEEIGPAIRQAQASNVPTLVNIMVDADVIHPGVVASVSVDETKEISIPYYENIPLT